MSQHWRYTPIPETTDPSLFIRLMNTRLRDLAGVLAAVPLSCLGDPNGVIEGSVGDLCVRLDGGAGTVLYVKETGDKTLTGWVSK